MGFWAEELTFKEKHLRILTCQKKTTPLLLSATGRRTPLCCCFCSAWRIPTWPGGRYFFVSPLRKNPSPPTGKAVFVFEDCPGEWRWCRKMIGRLTFQGRGNEPCIPIDCELNCEWNLCKWWKTESPESVVFDAVCVANVCMCVYSW